MTTNSALITPRRRHNSYREYDVHLVDRAKKIRGLLDSGIPTRIIGDVLPCLDQPQDIVGVDPQLGEMLVRERDRMDERIALLEQKRLALTRHIAAMNRAPRTARSRSVG